LNTLCEILNLGKEKILVSKQLDFRFQKELRFRISKRWYEISKEFASLEVWATSKSQ